VLFFCLTFKNINYPPATSCNKLKSTQQQTVSSFGVLLQPTSTCGSDGTAVGVGVGLGAGVLLLIILGGIGVLIFLKVKQKNNTVVFDGSEMQLRK